MAPYSGLEPETGPSQSPVISSFTNRALFGLYSEPPAPVLAGLVGFKRTSRGEYRLKLFWHPWPDSNQLTDVRSVRSHPVGRGILYLCRDAESNRLLRITPSSVMDSAGTAHSFLGIIGGSITASILM